MSPASAALLAPTPWSLMPGAIARAESALKLKLPPLLRRLYAEVGNGGWGPSSGLLPLWRDDDNPTPRWAGPALTQVSRVEECPALLPLCLWPCGIWWGHACWSFVDTAHPDLPVVRREPAMNEDWRDRISLAKTGQDPASNPYRYCAGWRECASLHNWLQGWLDSECLWSRAYPEGWPEGGPDEAWR